MRTKIYYKKKLQRGIMIFLMTICSNIVTAQVDSNFIEILPDQNVLGVVLQLRDLKVKFSPKDNPTEYHQISDFGIGVRFKRKKIGATIVVPILRLNNPGAVRPSSLGLRVRWYPKNFFVFGIFQRVNGMYRTNPLNNDDIYNANSKLRFGSVNVMRLSNSKRFNMKSTFRTVDMQKKSAGSFVLNGLVEYQYFKSNASSLDTAFIYDKGLERYEGLRTALGGGYAYTQLINYFQFTGLVAMGPEMRQFSLLTNNEELRANYFYLNPRIMVMGSIAYNTPSFFWSIVGFYHPGILKNSLINVNTETSRLRITIGKRFD